METSLKKKKEVDLTSGNLFKKIIHYYTDWTKNN